MPRQCSECRSDGIKSGSNHEFEMLAKCLDSALNVKSDGIKSGSNHEFEMVAKFLDNALNVEVMESKVGATMNLRWRPNAPIVL